MSEIGLNYSASTQPSDVGADIGLSFQDTTLVATIEHIDNFIISLTPSGGVSEQIVSGVAWPLAQLLGAVLPPLATSLFAGFHFPLITISPTTQKVDGEELQITPGQLQLVNFNNMLLIQGNVDIV
ncbi:hypothetical protein GK047_12500 [Paenibacillus sp. SYP-B3998]|uniref:Uncharacterized protein n=1 Tax=Paenibacillus sp. SYP-B3998 TaxID=2678564 RepID=A0A6G3ZZ30_9BACL|nr:hypothetical protein [Paenibacillus sp. SYP-B3998]NEW06831.1 hypothetical protein [Paenibacillus sp. SYP-B3998]